MSSYHYKTINKIHIKWSKNNVYTDAFEEIMNIKQLKTYI